MKNVLFLGLAAAVLFAVSAGLSIWLNQPKAGEGADAATKDSTQKGKDGNVEAPSKPVIAPPAIGDASESVRLAAQLESELALAAKREKEFTLQQEMYQIVIEDLRHEMQALQKQLDQLERDKKQPSGARPGNAVQPAPAMPPGAKKALPDAADAALKNLRLATGITESMQPENAARIVEQLAKSGKADTAVQLLAKLNPRQAARILALIPDEKLSAQLFERLLANTAPAAGSRTP